MFNRYAYAANDPVNMIDPDGRVPQSGVKYFLATSTPEQKQAAVDAAVDAVAAAAIEIAPEVAAAALDISSLHPAGKVVKAGVEGIKAVDRSRAKRRAAREAQRNASPSVPTSRTGRNTSDGRGGPRGQIKQGSDGKPAGVADGTRDRNNGTDHPPGMEAGRLKSSDPTGRYGQPRIQNDGKGKAEIDDR